MLLKILLNKLIIGNIDGDDKMEACRYFFGIKPKLQIHILVFSATVYMDIFEDTFVLLFLYALSNWKWQHFAKKSFLLPKKDPRTTFHLEGFKNYPSIRC